MAGQEIWRLPEAEFCSWNCTCSCVFLYLNTVCIVHTDLDFSLEEYMNGFVTFKISHRVGLYRLDFMTINHV